MGGGDAAENDGDEQLAALAIPETISATSNSKFNAPVPPPIVKKKKLVDDWDAGEDDLAEEEAFRKSELENSGGKTDDEEFERLMNVYKAFKLLKSTFDEKFKVIWA